MRHGSLATRSDFRIRGHRRSSTRFCLFTRRTIYVCVSESYSHAIISYGIRFNVCAYRPGRCFLLMRLRHRRAMRTTEVAHSKGSERWLSGHFRWIDYPFSLRCWMLLILIIFFFFCPRWKSLRKSALGKGAAAPSFFRPHPVFISTLNCLLARAQKSEIHYIGHVGQILSDKYHNLVTRPWLTVDWLSIMIFLPQHVDGFLRSQKAPFRILPCEVQVKLREKWQMRVETVILTLTAAGKVPAG